MWERLYQINARALLTGRCATAILVGRGPLVLSLSVTAAARGGHAMDEIPWGSSVATPFRRESWPPGQRPGVGYEFFDVYAANVRKVTPADVQRVTKQYLGVLRMIIVQPP
jgi:hypothetical protein